MFVCRLVGFLSWFLHLEFSLKGISRNLVCFGGCEFVIVSDGHSLDSVFAQALSSYLEWCMRLFLLYTLSLVCLYRQQNSQFMCLTTFIRSLTKCVLYKVVRS